MATTDLPTAGEASRLNRLYFIAWRWHFHAELYVIPFVSMLATTGHITPLPS